MGSTPLLLDEEILKNCINLHNPEGYKEYLEQHDIHGNIVYYYKIIFESFSVKLLIYNSNKQEIGSI